VTAATDAPRVTPGSSRTLSDTLLLTLLASAQFMVVLDVSIVNVALPAIQDDLRLDAAGLQWVINAYAVVFAGFLLLGGRAADVFGPARLFRLGLVVFTLASLVGGLAQTGPELLIARAVQGLGAATLSPVSLAILTTTFAEGHRRNRAIGVWAAVAGAGGATGAVLGGVLTGYASWRWILLVNVPVGIVGLVAARRLPPDHPHGSATRLDVLGAVLITGAVMTAVYAVVGTQEHGWMSTRTLLALSIALALLVMFVVNEASVASSPLIPGAVLRIRTLATANAMMFLVGAAIFSSWYFLSLYLHTTLGFTPMQTGLAFLPQTLAIVAGAQISSRLVTSIGAKPLVLVGSALSCTGLLILSAIVDHDSYAVAVAPMTLVTLGMGLTFTPLTVAATNGVPRELAGLASGLITTLRQLGGAVGLATMATAAAARTRSLATTSTAVDAATSGYARAFFLQGVCALAAMLIAATLPAAPRPSRERV
jgi:EmrB/QacA subfamily drug resistance transporter